MNTVTEDSKFFLVSHSEGAHGDTAKLLKTLALI